MSRILLPMLPALLDSFASSPCAHSENLRFQISGFFPSGFMVVTHEKLLAIHISYNTHDITKKMARMQAERFHIYAIHQNY